MAIRRRKLRFFDEIFEDLEREIAEMEENISMIFKEAHRMSIQDEDRSYAYGFTMYIDREGKQYVEEFENIPEGGSSSSKISESLQYEEPFSEIIEGENEISIIIELAGVEQNDIKLNASENELRIDVSTKDKRYHKVLNLPCRVKPETTKATYKNGILEIKIARAGKKTNNARVKIE